MRSNARSTSNADKNPVWRPRFGLKRGNTSIIRNRPSTPHPNTVRKIVPAFIDYRPRVSYDHLPRPAVSNVPDGSLSDGIGWVLTYPDLDNQVEIRLKDIPEAMTHVAVYRKMATLAPVCTELLRHTRRSGAPRTVKEDAILKAESVLHQVLQVAEDAMRQLNNAQIAGALHDLIPRRNQHERGSEDSIVPRLVRATYPQPAAWPLTWDAWGCAQYADWNSRHERWGAPMGDHLDINRVGRYDEEDDTRMEDRADPPEGELAEHMYDNPWAYTDPWDRPWSPWQYVETEYSQQPSPMSSVHSPIPPTPSPMSSVQSPIPPTPSLDPMSDSDLLVGMEGESVSIPEEDEVLDELDNLVLRSVQEVLDEPEEDSGFLADTDTQSDPDEPVVVNHEDADDSDKENVPPTTTTTLPPSFPSVYVEQISSTAQLPLPARTLFRLVTKLSNGWINAVAFRDVPTWCTSAFVRNRLRERRSDLKEDEIEQWAAQVEHYLFLALNPVTFTAPPGGSIVGSHFTTYRSASHFNHELESTLDLAADHFTNEGLVDAHIQVCVPERRVVLGPRN